MEKPEPFVRPRQRDFVETLPDLPGKHSKFVQLVRAAQQLFVIAARALMRAM